MSAPAKTPVAPRKSSPLPLLAVAGVIVAGLALLLCYGGGKSAEVAPAPGEKKKSDETQPAA